MRKLYIFGLIGLVAIIIGLAWADQMTLTTYYPAPYGVYNDMRVMNSLGVGTTEPEQPLEVIGTAKADSAILNPVVPPLTGEDGELVCDSSDNNTIKRWDSATNAWVPLGGTGVWQHVGQKVFDGVIPNVWIDLDLSSYVGNRRTLVMLKVETPGGSTRTVGVRTKGDARELGYVGKPSAFGAGASGAAIQPNKIVYLFAETNASGMVEIWDFYNQSSEIWLVGYI